MFMPNKSMMTMNGLEKMKMMSLNPMMMTMKAEEPKAKYTGRIGKSLPMKLNSVGAKSNTNDESLPVGSKLESQ